MSNIDIDIENKQTELSKSVELLNLGQRLNRENNGKFNQEAFDCLAKSVKLDPKLIDSWLELAESYQRRNDIEGAIACLENATKQCERQDKRVLRCLATCLRSRDVNCDNSDNGNNNNDAENNEHKKKFQYLLDSLELSKQALKLDMEDPENYYNLAKAYMCLFFYTSCFDRKQLELSRMAYEKSIILSENLKPGSQEYIKWNENLGDFMYNFSTILLYEQDFQKTLDCLNVCKIKNLRSQEAIDLLDSLVEYINRIDIMLRSLQPRSLDNSNQVEKEKKFPRKYRKDLEQHNFIESHQSLKKNKTSFNSMVNTIINDQKKMNSNQQDKLQILKISSEITLSNLIENCVEQNDNENHVMLMHVKPLELIDGCTNLFLTFVAVDKNLTPFVLTIYNMSNQRAPTSRDVITIVDPKIEVIKISNLQNSHDNKTKDNGYNKIISKLPNSGKNKKIVGTNETKSMSFNMIRLRQFRDFYINGSRIDITKVAKPQIKVSMLPG